jgi:hypothetical protein
METIMTRGDKYKAAIETHRQYDTLSIAAVGGMFAVTYGCYNLHKELSAIMYTKYFYIMGAAAIAILYLLYLKLSIYATIARNVARVLEKTDGLGVSEVYYLTTNDDKASKEAFEPYAVKRSFWSFSIKNLVFIIALGQFVALLISAFNTY